MATGQLPVSERPVAPGLAPLPPQRRPGCSSRGLKFDPLFVGPSDVPLLPIPAPGHGGAALPATGNRYSRFGTKAGGCLEWPPSGDLKVGEVFPVGNQQQHQQQQRYQPLPSLGQQFSSGERLVRNAFLSGGGGGDDDGDFDNRLTPGGAFLGLPRQLPLGHFAPEYAPPLPQASVLVRGQGQEEACPDRRQACPIDDIDDDDKLEAEALAAVATADIPSAGTGAGNMTALAGNFASLEEISATIRAAAAGQDAGGHPGEDPIEAAGCGDRDEGAGEGNDGPLRSCCSFLALNAQDIVGDADSWQDDDDDDGGGAFMME